MPSGSLPACRLAGRRRARYNATMSRAETAEIVGVVLAGGRSQRMGGGDKGLRDLGGGRSMLGHVVARLGPQVGRLILNANGDPARFRHFALPVVPDAHADFPGPLAGVLAGIRWAIAEAPGARDVATVSSDVPFIPADLVARLAAAADSAGAAIAVALSNGVLHPVIALWSVGLADALEAALANGERSVGRWAASQGAVAVPFEPIRIAGREIDPFFNANTPEELLEAAALSELLERTSKETE